MKYPKLFFCGCITNFYYEICRVNTYFCVCIAAWLRKMCKISLPLYSGHPAHLEKFSNILDTAAGGERCVCNWYSLTIKEDKF